MNLITWNIKKDTELLRRALGLLSSASPTLLCLQEVPSHLTPELLNELGAPSNYRRHYQYVDNTYKRNLVMCSNGLRSASQRKDPEGKLIAETFFFPGIGLVDVMTVHAISHRTEDSEVGRGNRARRLRSAMEKVRRLDKAIVLGDFNADPFDVEMWESDHVYALRDRAAVVHYANIEPNRLKQPWWNPCWSLLGDNGSSLPVGGTHYYDKKLKHSHWFLFDQALVSHTLIDRVNSVRVLSEVEGLLLEPGVPGPWVFRHGDHLPLQVELRTNGS